MSQNQTYQSDSNTEPNGLTPSQIGILNINNLSYKLPDDLAVVLQRNVQSSFFTSQSYAPGATMTCIVNSGSGFVNLRQSYLVLDVQNTSVLSSGATTCYFGNHGGSAANFINRIQLIAKNGAVIERIDNANQLAACKVNYYSKSWQSSVGSLMGIVPANTGSTLTTAASAALGWTTGAPGATLRFMIPLYVFSTFCDSMGSLCPAQLISGSRFEILLESGANAMIAQAVTNVTSLNYAITACRIDFETYLLTDSVMRVINQTAATQGLEVVSATTQDTQSQRLSTQLVLDVNRSCSRALSVIYKERTANPGNNVQYDSMASLPIDGTNYPTQYWVRAGQLYFPQSTITGTANNASAGYGAVGGKAEVDLYLQTLRCFQKLYSNGLQDSAATSLQDFRGIAQSANVNGGSNACFALDLQRSAILTSGIPLANARMLSIQYTNAGSGTYAVDVFTTFQIVVRTYISQCSIEV